MLQLNAQGLNVPAIATIFQCHQHTVRATLRQWENYGLGGLWEAPGRGAKPKWQPADLDYLSECLEQDHRTYTSSQLAQKLKQERSVDLSSDRLRRLLKKKISLEILSLLDQQHRYIFEPLKSIGIKAIEGGRTTRPLAGFAALSPQDP